MSRSFADSGSSLLPCALVGASGKGLFSCDRKAAACGLLCVHLVHFTVFPLESRSIKAIRKNGRKAGDILTGLDFFNPTGFHFPLDAVFQTFDFCGGFRCKGFPLFEGFDFGNDFDA